MYELDAMPALSRPRSTYVPAVVDTGLEDPGDDLAQALPLPDQSFIPGLEIQVSNVSSRTKSSMCQSNVQPLPEVGLPYGFWQSPALTSYPVLDPNFWGQYTAIPEAPYGLGPSQVCTAIFTH
jgi:hypothetical protein